jgi:hypothetical protein
MKPFLTTVFACLALTLGVIGGPVHRPAFFPIVHVHAPCPKKHVVCPRNKEV